MTQKWSTLQGNVQLFVCICLDYITDSALEKINKNLLSAKQKFIQLINDLVEIFDDQLQLHAKG